MSEYMFATLMIISLTLALSIETTSWSLRGSATIGNKGLFISRTNIYLYSARLFVLFYSTGLSYLVDQKQSLSEILQLIFSSYLLAAVVHTLLLNRHIHNSLCICFLKILFIHEKSNILGLKKENIFLPKLFVATSLSAFVFCCAMVAPYVAASIYPEFRMTLSALGQIVNALGTVVLLFFVDPILYKLMDMDVLSESLEAFYAGRFLGFLVGALLVAYIDHVVF